LKYAGATAAVVGASALGIDYVLKPPPAASNQTTTALVSSRTISTTATTSVPTTDLELTLFADWHGDGKQQPDEPTIKDVPVKITGFDTDYRAVLVADSDGRYWARNIPVGKQYRIAPKNDNFRYVANSNSQYTGINDYSYAVDSDEPRLHLGLMEGFETLPVLERTKFTWDRYYDWDPSPDRYLWWNGQSGDPRYIVDPNGGWSPNEASIDYGMQIGTPVVAKAPGYVADIQLYQKNGLRSVHVLHQDNLFSFYDHISKSLVSIGDTVERGQIIAESGDSGDPGYPHLDSTLAINNRAITIDEFHPIWPVTPDKSGYWVITAVSQGGGKWVSVPFESNPSGHNSWTVLNKPQYPKPSKPA
jgi:murein DD-endopeptidase MepM/ murein hydrolase activator NlpD